MMGNKAPFLLVIESTGVRKQRKLTETCRKTLTNSSKKVIYRCIGCLNLANIFFEEDIYP